GTWYDVEPGTNPGFLYQQSTMRDAIVAGLTLNIFNKHADRIMMANIAQTVNVLQSVILTDGEKMIKTPTYYIFKMYKEHQQNTLVGSYITTENIHSENDNKDFPQLVESASVDENGMIYSTITNTSATKSAKIKCQIADTKVTGITAEILTGECHDHNTFDNADVVKTAEFTDFRQLRDGFTATIPACSVVKFTVNK
ncbi:MAG: alpha-N-arabinofuranosidase, partial [Eubacterium sp.]|nr:alpha-N-arabinofuranosidase [Eubacterium sp.]